MAKMTEAEILAKMKVLEDRIKAPSIWGRVPCGVRFEDLQEKRYEDTVRLLKKHYLPEEITYRSVKIADDKEGTDEFTHNLRIWMKDKMSIAAVKEGTDKLVGCLIMRIQEKHAFSRTFSRVKITYNPQYSTVMTFYNAIEKPVDLFAKLGVRRYFKVYLVALKPRYRHRGYMKEMLKSAILLCAGAHVPGISGIFTTSRQQQIAEELGFQKYHEIFYNKYKVEDNVVFAETGAGNDSAALMAYRIPEVEEIQEYMGRRRRVAPGYNQYSRDAGEAPLDPQTALLRQRGYMKEMLKSAILLCAGAHVPGISGIFTTSRQQQIAEELGFQKYHEIFYNKYKVEDNVVFAETGAGNDSAALMAYRIPEVEEIQEVESQHSSRFNIQATETD